MFYVYIQGLFDENIFYAINNEAAYLTFMKTFEFPPSNDMQK
jgi:hypothetical protein